MCNIGTMSDNQSAEMAAVLAGIQQLNIGLQTLGNRMTATENSVAAAVAPGRSAITSSIPPVNIPSGQPERKITRSLARDHEEGRQSHSQIYDEIEITDVYSVLQSKVPYHASVYRYCLKVIVENGGCNCTGDCMLNCKRHDFCRTHTCTAACRCRGPINGRCMKGRLVDMDLLRIINDSDMDTSEDVTEIPRPKKPSVNKA